MQKCDLCDVDFKGKKCPNCNFNDYNEQESLILLKRKGYTFGKYGFVLNFKNQTATEISKD